MTKDFLPLLYFNVFEQKKTFPKVSTANCGLFKDDVYPKNKIYGLEGRKSLF